KLVYALSYTYSEFPVVHEFTDENVDAYIAIGLSGTEMAQESVYVTFERNDSSLSEYNRINFDLDTTNFAKEVDPSRYTTDSWTAEIKEGACKGAVRLSVNINGLSPDSIWTIPLIISEVSGAYDGLNEDLQMVLYRFYFENDYASIADYTTYLAKGYIYDDVEGDSTAVAATKRAFPISKSKTRVTYASTTDYSSLDAINQNSIIFDVKDDSSIEITAVDPTLLNVRTVGEPEDNIYAADYMGSYRFYVNYEYRYRSSTSSDWSDWLRCQESYISY
ncbi:MAG: DUF4361 domain-containing protein, partial [Rikenellaceae bacterium]